MTFLNPLYLLGAAAGIIPFLIHLLHRRRLKVIEFSSLEFLKKIEGRRTRWFRVREMLLLILRCLAVVLLAIAISRPVLRSAAFGSLSAHARTSSIFIVDNSYSMGLGGRTEGSFANAKLRADETLKAMDKGDDVSLILASDISMPVFDGPVHDKSLVRSAIADAYLSSRSTDFKPSLEMAMSLLDNSKNLNREVYLFTDMQRSAYQSFSRGPIHNTKGKRLYVIDSRPTKHVENLAVEDLVLADPLLFEGGKLELIATLRNHGERHSNVSLLSRLDDREMGVKEASIPGNSMRAVELAFSVDEPGLHHFRVDISDDDLMADNTRYISFRMPGKVKAALITERRTTKRNFVETALSPEAGLSIFIPKAFSKGELSSLNLEDYAVVALIDVSSINSADVLRLANYVQSGGGLLLSVGSSADIHFYNSVLLPKLLPLELKRREPSRRDERLFMRISSLDFTHPVFSRFKEKEKGDLSTARIYNRLVCDAKSGIAARLSDGNPFMVSKVSGRGKVILSSIPLDGSYSDLPLKAIYVPLIHRIFRYLSMGEEVDYNMEVGERLSVPVSGLKQVECRPPGGRVVKVEPRMRSGRMYAEFDETEEPGIYTMHAGEEELARFTVNLPAQESDTQKAGEDEVKSYLAELRPEFLGVSDKPEAAIFGVRLGVELTNPLIILVLLILVLEMVIAGRWKGPLEPEL